MFAPNVDQMHVINHLKGAPAEEKRNVLVESARLARGNIQDLSKLNANDHDAVIFPGQRWRPALTSGRGTDGLRSSSSRVKTSF